MERYSRQTILPEVGTEGQRRLLASSALIVGAGGLGSPVALYLAAAGVGRLGLCDTDTVSLSNLQRQILYKESETGKPKVECAAGRLAELRSDLRCDLHTRGLTPDNARELIAAYDIVVDCCDNFATRYLIADTCRETRTPWVHGSIGAFEGRVTTFLPDSGHCFDDLYPDRTELCARRPSAGGVLGAVPGAIGSLQACEVLKVLGAFGEPLSGRLLAADFLTNRYYVIDF